MLKQRQVCLSVVCGVALFIMVACGKSERATSADLQAPADENASGATPNDGANGQGVDRAKLDADIAHLEAEAERNPEDDSARDAVAAAYVRRGDALRASQKNTEAMSDYQSALRFNPDYEDAQMRIAQLSQESGSEPRADDGKPVTVPARPAKP